MSLPTTDEYMLSPVERMSCGLKASAVDASCLATPYLPAVAWLLVMVAWVWLPCAEQSKRTCTAS